LGWLTTLESGCAGSFAAGTFFPAVDSIRIVSRSLLMLLLPPPPLAFWWGVLKFFEAEEFARDGFGRFSLERVGAAAAAVRLRRLFLAPDAILALLLRVLLLLDSSDAVRFPLASALFEGMSWG
jgi:hypothetical protein